MIKTKVSIILPIYNVEQYLRQCLESIRNQTFRDFECICINDCSLDNSLQIVKEYQQKDSRFFLIDLKENLGLAQARNEGINKADGEYILFVDSDDWIKSNCIEKSLKIIEENQADIVQFSYTIFYQYDNLYQPGKIFDKVSKTDTDSQVLHKTYEGTVWKRLYKRELIIKNKVYFYPGRVSEDGVWSAILFLYTRNVVYIEDELYVYRRQNPTSITSNLNKLFVDWFYNFFTMIKDINERKFLSNDVIKWCIHVFCWDYSRIGRFQSKSCKYEMLKHSICILKYLLKNSKNIVTSIKIWVLLVILKMFNLYSYQIIRVLKNMV